LSIFEDVILYIAGLAGVIYLLDYAAKHSERWKGVLRWLSRSLRLRLSRVRRGYLFLHPYLGVAVVLCGIGLAARRTYDFATGGETPWWIVALMWNAVILFSITVVPEQIRRIRGEDWPP